MTGKLAWFGAIISGCAMAAACGSSSSNGGSPTDGGLGDATSPSGDDTGTPSGDDGSAGPSVMCGATTCQAPSGGFLPLAACCLPDNSCGGTFSAGGLGGLASMFGGGAAVDASAFDASAFGDAAGLLGDGGIPCLNLTAGTSDPTCMSLSVAGMTLNGCCTSAGVCGNDLSIVGLGCNSFAALAGGLGGPGVLCGDAAAVVTPDAQADVNVPDVAVDAPADSPSE
jgi:hypothetical protein